MATAVTRRCQQELGFSTELNFVYKFKYQAAFANLGSEHELCSVYIGQFDGEPHVNSTEVSAWRWISPAQLNRELANPTKLFTPWLKLSGSALTKILPRFLSARSNVSRLALPFAARHPSDRALQLSSAHRAGFYPQTCHCGMTIKPCIRRVTDTRTHSCFNLLRRSSGKIRKALTQRPRVRQHLVIHH